MNLSLCSLIAYIMAFFEDEALPYEVKNEFLLIVFPIKKSADGRFKSSPLIYPLLNVEDFSFCNKLKLIFVHVGITCDASFLDIRAFQTFRNFFLSNSQHKFHSHKMPHIFSNIISFKTFFNAIVMLLFNAFFIDKSIKKFSYICYIFVSNKSSFLFIIDIFQNFGYAF